MANKRSKNKVVPRTDCNQNIRESMEKKKKQRDYIINKIAKYQAKQLLAKQHKGENLQTIDGLSEKEN